jgi:hypothetical protein
MPGPHSTPPDSTQPGSSADRRRAQEVTHAETFFYLRHVESRAPLVVRLRDGETLTGSIAWYDRAALRLDLATGGHRIVQKRSILCLEDVLSPPPNVPNVSQP